jgi:hypothetical protein
VILIKNERVDAAIEVLQHYLDTYDQQWLRLIALEVLKASDAAQAFANLPNVTEEEGYRMRDGEATAL